MLCFCRAFWNHYFVPDKLEAGAFYVACAGQCAGCILHKDIRIFMILDIGWAGLIVAYMAIKRFEFGGIDMVASLYTVLLLVIVAGFKHPAFLAEKAEELPLICTGWLRTRFLAGAVLGIIWMLAVMLFGA